MTQAQIDLATFASIIWGVAVLGGILFATLKKSTYYRIGIGIGMSGLMIGGLMIYIPKLSPYASLIRVAGTDLMLTFVLISYYLNASETSDRQTRARIVWAVIAIEVIGLLAVPFVQLLGQVDMGALREIRTERAAIRAESEVSRLQEQYAIQHEADSIQHVSDSLQIHRLQVKLTEQTAILKTTQNLIEKLEVLYKQLLLEVQKNRFEMRRIGQDQRLPVEQLAGKNFLSSEMIDRIFSGPVGRPDSTRQRVSFKRVRD